MALALPWEYAASIAVAAGATGTGLARATTQRARSTGAFCHEAAIVLGLYGLWQLAGRLSVIGVDGAFTRAEAISRIETWLPLPSVAQMQHLVLWSPPLTQAANIYYAVVHFPATIALLIWLFFCHRREYRRVRWVLALTTFACLGIQLIPVAPPRMMPDVVDTGILFGQSVYGAGFGADEFSAMPSVHVAWALAVGWYVWRIARSRWRWVGPTHAVLTVLVVLVTGNHWWLDGIAAGVILGAAAAVVAAVGRRASSPDRAGMRVGAAVPAEASPAEAVPAEAERAPDGG